MPKLKLPKPVIEKEIHYENFQEGMEKFYFTAVEILENSLGYSINKVEDSFSTSVGSAQWQVYEQRKALQQEKATQYLTTIGGMIKAMMTLFRELKIQDERLGYYRSADTGNIPAERSLKDLWISLVEGGGTNPASVIGLAQQVGFVTLPDLFFSLNPRTTKEVESMVEKVETNKQVKGVLKNKLFQYIEWRARTYSEIKSRRYFNIKYLAQHFNVIKMYLGWIKPYMQNIRNLSQREKTKAYHLLQMSEGVISDVEIVCKKKNRDPVTEYETIFPVITVEFHYRTRPVLSYHGHEYQKGAIQVGRIEAKIKGYKMTLRELEEYEKIKDMDTIELLEAVDESMAALLSDSNSKRDFEDYLKEAREGKNNDEEKSKKVKVFDLNLLKMFLPSTSNKKSGKELKKEKTEKNADYIQDYNSSKVKSKYVIAKFRKKHKLTITDTNKLISIFEKEEIELEDTIKKDIDTLVDIVKINYGMVRYE